jgi:hypothetical protein
MTEVRRTALSVVLTIALIVALGLASLVAQSFQSYGAEAKACKLMPAPELEAQFRGKVTNPQGMDGDSSVCTVNIGSVAIKLQSSPPGAAGVPTSIQQGLLGARMMLGEAGQSPSANTRDFGKVGCLSMKMKTAFGGKPLAKALLTTSCFLVDGGYLNISIAGENSKQLRFELVKALLEKAAAKR